jgi:hypothetical protein
MKQYLLDEHEKVRLNRQRRRKLEVLQMCITPRSLDEIKKAITTTGINGIMADLKGAGLIFYNQSLKKYECNNIEVF